jgi:hypothetical protein
LLLLLFYFNSDRTFLRKKFFGMIIFNFIFYFYFIPAPLKMDNFFNRNLSYVHLSENKTVKLFIEIKTFEIDSLQFSK